MLRGIVGGIVVVLVSVCSLTTVQGASASITVGDVSLRPASQVRGTFGSEATGLEFVEPLADRCYAVQAQGGTFQVQLKNEGRSPAGIDSVRLDGEEVDGLTARPDGDPSACTTGDVRWMRMKPSTIPAGESAVLLINGPRFRPGAEVSLTMKSGSQTIRINEILARPRIKVSGIRFSPNMNRITVFVQPTTPGHSSLRFSRLLVNGSTVKAKSVGGIERGRMVLTAPLSGVSKGEPTTVSVRYRDRRRAIRASGHVRAFPSSFPVGMGVGFGLSAIPSGTDAETLRASGIDTLFAYDQTVEFDQLIAGAEAGGFDLAVGPRIPGDGFSRSERTEQFVERMPELASHEVVTAWIPFDEPDIPLAEPAWRYRSSNYIARLAGRVEATDPSRPVFMNVWSPNAASEYGPIGDVSGWDHYILDRAPLALESARSFARSNRAAVSPSPYWMWNQALAYGQGRLPSADETRAYTSLGVGHGVGGVIWFSWDGQNLDRPLWAEMSAESRVLSAIGPRLANAVSWTGGATTDESGIDLGSMVGPQFAFLAVTNLDYEIAGPTPYRFSSRSGVTVEWSLPTWMRKRKDLVAVDVTPGQTPVALGRMRHGKKVELGSFESSRWLVAAPRDVVAKLVDQIVP